jgi:hypothetical protein
MNNTQTAIIAAAIMSTGLIVGAAVLQPWQWFTPAPPLCIGAPRGAVEAQDFAQRNGCRLH